MCVKSGDMWSLLTDGKRREGGGEGRPVASSAFSFGLEGRGGGV